MKLVERNLNTSKPQPAFKISEPHHVRCSSSQWPLKLFFSGYHTRQSWQHCGRRSADAGVRGLVTRLLGGPRIFPVVVICSIDSIEFKKGYTMGLDHAEPSMARVSYQSGGDHAMPCDAMRCHARHIFTSVPRRWSEEASRAKLQDETAMPLWRCLQLDWTILKLRHAAGMVSNHDTQKVDRNVLFIYLSIYLSHFISPVVWTHPMFVSVFGIISWPGSVHLRAQKWSGHLRNAEHLASLGSQSLNVSR